MTSDSTAATRFNSFYERYAEECRDLRVAPLAPDVVLALLETMRQRAGATLQ